jgi:hypothetical protein
MVKVVSNAISKANSFEILSTPRPLLNASLMDELPFYGTLDGSIIEVMKSRSRAWRTTIIYSPLKDPDIFVVAFAT